MTFTDVLRKVALPVMTLVTTAGTSLLTLKLVQMGQYMAAGTTGLLAVGFAYFLANDVRKLLTKPPTT